MEPGEAAAKIIRSQREQKEIRPVQKHMHCVSRERAALAQEMPDMGEGGLGDLLGGIVELFDPIAYLNFVIAVLNAVNSFVVRKIDATP